MARGSGTVTVSIVGKADKLREALGDSEKQLAGFGKKLDDFGDKATDLGKKFTTRLTLPIVGGLGLATKAAAEDEEAQAKLAKTLNNTVGATANVVKGVEAQLAAFMKVSTFSDDDLRPAFANLVRSTKDVDEANKLMATAMDIAAAKGLPLEQVSMALAKAHDGNVGALGRLGIATKDTEGQTKSFEQVMRDANATFGGSASDALDTTAGRSKALKRDLGEMTEEIGSALIPIIEKLIPIVRAVADWFSGLSPTTQTLILVVAGLAAAIGPLVTIVGSLATAFTFLAANPIVLVIAGVAALAAGLVIAYQKSETFRDIVNGVFQAVANAAGDMAGWVLDAFDKFLGAIATTAEAAGHLPFIGDKFDGIAESIRNAQHDIQGWADTAHKGINIVSEDLERARDALRGMGLEAAKLGFGGGGGGIIVGSGPVRARAAGGPVSAGRPYLVGEQGPELFVPGRSGGIIPNGAGGGGNTYNFNGPILGSDEASLARYLSDLLTREAQRSG